MRRFTATAAVFGLFVTGILVGVVGTHAFYAHHLREPDELVDLGSRWHVNRLRDELDLTPEQERRMRDLVAATRQEIRGLREELMPGVRDRIARAHEEFVEILDPAQRRRLDEIMRRHGRRYMRAFGFPPEAEPGHHGLRGPGRWHRGEHHRGRDADSEERAPRDPPEAESGSADPGG